MARAGQANDADATILPRMTTIRHDSAHGRWELVRLRPVPALEPFVAAVQGYREGVGPSVRRREMPNGNVVMILNLGADWLIGQDRAGGRPERFGSFAGGAYDRYAVSQSTGPAHCIQVDFTPIGAARFFGTSMPDLTRSVTALDDILGATAGRLVERLHEVEGWLARLALVERAIATRILPTAPAGLPAFVLGRIAASQGAVGIAVLARDRGVSRKHLSVSFRDAVGVSPSTYSRVCRFVRAARLIQAVAEPRWTELALDCGYYDQSHFNRDFRRFSGYTPTEYRRRALADGTGILDA